jgi:TRAP transporter 4TM/12TM fusion protein
VFPGLLKHAGASWSQLVNHQYLTSQGIYGVAVGVVATYVFHFVLFGVLATRIGLGQLFLDVASSIAGRYAGGPAKVSVFGSAMFGMLSGSSVANAVTVGSLTIPAMIRVGYKREFAGAVEAASSTGGQITPPVLGAAAFLMIEFLSVPYQTIIAAAAVPAFMHFFGVFMQVHFEAKRFGLRGLTEEEMPKLRRAGRALAHADPAGAADLHPGQSGARPTWRPSAASAPAPSSACAPVRATTRAALGAAGGLHACCWCWCSAASRPRSIKLGLFGVALVATPLLAQGLKHPGPHRPPALVEAFSTGAKYALAVGAAAATVGIVIGVVTLTGVGFKLSTIITGAAQAVAGGVGTLVPAA